MLINNKQPFYSNNYLIVLTIALLFSIVFGCGQNTKTNTLLGKWIPYRVTGNNDQYNVNETKLAFKWMQYGYVEFDDSSFKFFDKSGDELGIGNYIVENDSIYTFINSNKNDSSTIKIKFVNEDIFKAIDSTREVVVWFKRN